jgi:hypothetical protein
LVPKYSVNPPPLEDPPPPLEFLNLMTPLQVDIGGGNKRKDWSGLAKRIGKRIGKGLGTHNYVFFKHHLPHKQDKLFVKVDHTT